VKLNAARSDGIAHGNTMRIALEICFDSGARRKSSSTLKSKPRKKNNIKHSEVSAL
jgi:hypothetical protein